MSDAARRVASSEERGPRPGFPRQLLVLAGTEFWERLSFAGMQALLVLYMVEHLFVAGREQHVFGLGAVRAAIEAITGPLSGRALAAQIFGLYIGSTYLAPLAGGVLGDRWIGRRAGVITGALLMGAGHACLSLEPLFLAALALLCAGAGLLRGNIVAQVSGIYDDVKDEGARDAGFQFYYALVNLGGFVAPLLTGTLAAAFGWSIAFGAAGVGMAVGLLTYVLGSSRTRSVRSAPVSRPVALNSSPGRRLGLVAAGAPLVLFWIAQSQIWNTYNVWARDAVQLQVGNFQVPVPWLQAVDALSVVVLVPPLLAFWRWQAGRGREPDEFGKLTLGALIFAAAVGWLALGAFLFRASRVPLPWAIAFHAVSGLGYLYVGPTAVAFFGRQAPSGQEGETIGAYLLTIFLGSLISGRLGGFYNPATASLFWAGHALAAAAAALWLALSRPFLVRRLGRQPSNPDVIGAGAGDPA